MWNSANHFIGDPALRECDTVVTTPRQKCHGMLGFDVETSVQNVRAIKPLTFIESDVKEVHRSNAMFVFKGELHSAKLRMLNG